MRRPHHRHLLSVLALTAVLLLGACGSDDETATEDGGADAASGDEASDESTAEDPGSETGGDEDGDMAAFEPPLVIGAIPDQDPELLTRNYGLLADFLSEELGVEVVYEPVTEYDAAVTAFRVGDLDLVWFGGLTGVQARLQVEGAEALAQRDIDEQFTSVFIASAGSGIEPIASVEELSVVAGHTLTFGSDSSTSGRLMPQSFLTEAGVSLDDLEGEPGFSGAHDKTIELVEAGTYEVGVLNSQVWRSRLEEGAVDTSKVVMILETPTYYDYHWVARPELGAEMQAAIVAALTSLDASDPDDAAILEFFGAGSFIETDNANYADIEAVGREVGLISD
jgi:phosphonate transport system substrate-binding protein